MAGIRSEQLVMVVQSKVIWQCFVSNCMVYEWNAGCGRVVSLEIIAVKATIYLFEVCRNFIYEFDCAIRSDEGQFPSYAHGSQNEHVCFVLMDRSGDPQPSHLGQQGGSL